MTTRTTAPAPPRADRDERQARRYWGSVQPPTNKADFFSAVTAPAAAEGDATVATIRMYGPIDSYGGWWGISAEDVARVLDALPASVEQIVLRINSPGGEVWEAMAILNLLGAHRASVIAVVDGIAASAASFIAAGCEETVASRGSQMMLHSPSVFAWGNAVEMRRTADFLDTLERSIVEVYTDKAGEKDWAAMLAAETWLTAEDAVSLGLADRVDVVPDSGIAKTVGVQEDDELDVVVITVDADDSATAEARTVRARAAAASARAAAPKPPSSTEPGVPNRKENVVANDAPRAGVNERLGTTDADAVEEAATAAPAAALATPATSTPAPVAAMPAGIVAVDANLWAETQENARRGAAAAAAQDSARRDGIIATALADGRISPTSSAHFRSMLDTDEQGTATALDSLQKNTALPVTELGNAVGEPENTAYPAHWKR